MQGFSQEKPTKEEFLNEVAGVLMEYNPKFFYLYGKPLKIDIEKYLRLENDGGWLGGIIQPNFKSNFTQGLLDAKFKELRAQVLRDTTNQIWNCNKIKKAVCVDEKRKKSILDSLNPSIYIVDWSEDSIAEETKKNRFSNYVSNRWSTRKVDSIIEERNKSKGRIPYEFTVIQQFSKPYFDSKNEFALIVKEESGANSLAVSGGLFVFQRIGGRWKIIGGKGGWAN